MQGLSLPMEYLYLQAGMPLAIALPLILGNDLQRPAGKEYSKLIIGRDTLINVFDSSFAITVRSLYVRPTAATVLLSLALDHLQVF